MNNKLNAIFRLIRLPNSFTAMSNILAAVVIATAGKFEIIDLVLLLLSSTSFYSAGMVFNDLADIKIDRVKNPKRPIVAGDLSKDFAIVLGNILIIVGLTSAFLVNNQAGFIAVCLLLSILVYDFLLKRSNLLASVGMGVCRALNWVLGMSLGTIFWNYSLFWLIYIGLLTFMARFEYQNNKIKKYVILGLTMIPILDSIILLINGFYFFSLITCMLIIPVYFLKKKFYMT